MNILRRELREHEKILRFFKSLPVDLRKHTQTFYTSCRPLGVCPECLTYSWPTFCSHYYPCLALWHP